jgi:Na+/proline symporter
MSPRRLFYFLLEVGFSAYFLRYWLTLFSVVLYTAVSGLKATFITDYLHTFTALILIIWFTIAVLVSDVVGGVYGLYDKVIAAEAAGQYFIEGNYKGSLLTFKSKGAFMFGISYCIANLALMTMIHILSPREKDIADSFRTLVFGRSLLLLRCIALFQVTTLPRSLSLRKHLTSFLPTRH